MTARDLGRLLSGDSAPSEVSVSSGLVTTATGGNPPYVTIGGRLLRYIDNGASPVVGDAMYVISDGRQAVAWGNAACPLGTVIGDSASSKSFTGSFGVSADGATLYYTANATVTTKEVRSLNVVTSSDSLINTVTLPRPFGGTTAATHDYGTGTTYWAMDISITGSDQYIRFGTGTSTIADFASSVVGYSPRLLWDPVGGHLWMGTWGDTANTTWGDDPLAVNSAKFGTLSTGGTFTEVHSVASGGDETSPAAEFATMIPLAADRAGGCWLQIGAYRQNETLGTFISWNHQLAHYDPVGGVTSGLGFGSGVESLNTPMHVTADGALYVYNQSTGEVGKQDAGPDYGWTVTACGGISNPSLPTFVLASLAAIQDDGSTISVTAESDANDGPWWSEQFTGG